MEIPVSSLENDSSKPVIDDEFDDEVYYTEKTVKITATYQARYELY